MAGWKRLDDMLNDGQAPIMVPDHHLAVLPGFSIVSKRLREISQKFFDEKSLRTKWSFASWPRLEGGELFGIHAYIDEQLYYLTHHKEWDAVKVQSIGYTGGSWDPIITSVLRDNNGTLDEAK